MVVVVDRRALTQEFRVDAYAEILSGLPARGVLQYGHDNALHRTGQQGAADDHNLVSFTTGELLADLLHDAADVSQIETAVGLPRRADTHHPDVALCDCRGMVGARDQAARRDRRSDQLLKPRLHDRALALTQEIDLDGIRIDTDHTVPVPREAGRRNHPDVAQSEHSNFHS